MFSAKSQRGTIIKGNERKTTKAAFPGKTVRLF
jgi:hypothetical protein